MPGTYTVQMQIALTSRNRRRLEYEIRQRRVDPADLVSAIIADSAPLLLSLPQEQTAEAAIPMRVYFSPLQRDQFLMFAATHETTIGALVSALLARYLESFPDPPERTEPRRLQANERAAYRRELTRLCAYRAQVGNASPQWLDSYIADLEAFLQTAPQEP
jgi:hypothetical protein